MNICCLIFEDITLLDAVGPLEVLSRLPGAQVHLAAPAAGPVRASRSRIATIAEYGLDDAPAADILLVPGGPGVRALLGRKPVLDWVRRQHEGSRWTTSVCTGSLLLAAAGLLEGRPATTHWASVEALAGYGARPVSERVVIDGKLVLGAGVSAGSDLALRLAALEAGEDVARAIQLRIEYDPMPPWDSGNPARADARVLELARGGLDRLAPV